MSPDKKPVFYFVREKYRNFYKKKLPDKAPPRIKSPDKNTEWYFTLVVVKNKENTKK